MTPQTPSHASKFQWWLVSEGQGIYPAKEVGDRLRVPQYEYQNVPQMAITTATGGEGEDIKKY
jgi:hypothetical protein